MAPDTTTTAQAVWTAQAVINLAALVLSPVIAVVVTLLYQHWNEKRRARLWIFNTFMAIRHQPLTDEGVRALNSIDVLFSDYPTVRDLWHQYFDMLGNAGLDNPQGWGQRQKKNLELITAMAGAVGYKKAISHLDVDRVYYPQGLVNDRKRADDLANELLRVLRNTQGLQVTPVTSSEDALKKA